MLLKYFYLDKLAQASYLLGCPATGEALIIDPNRDTRPYQVEARAQGMRIVGVTETHIHADFVSGARQLAEQTEAILYLSDEGDSAWKYEYVQNYKHVLLKGGDAFMIGNIRCEVLHTPGHTPEHLCFLVTDTVSANQPMGLFSGDFVFVGDVGRPDLLEKAANIMGTQETSARELFRSVQKLRGLPEYLQLWPGHGAGSACGKALGAVPSSTLGYEMNFNWAFRETDEDRFIKELLDGQPEPPRYFGLMKQVNKTGPAVLKAVGKPEKLPAEKGVEIASRGGTLLDTRPTKSFSKAHTPGALNIPYDNSFLNWAGWLVPYDRPLFLICESGRVEEIARDLTLIGLDHVTGFIDVSELSDYLKSSGSVQSFEQRHPVEISEEILNGHVMLMDVRNADEWGSGRMPGAQHFFLGELADRIDEVPRDKPVVLQCASGHRSAIAASILQAHGIAQVINLEGGIDAWKAAELPIKQAGADPLGDEDGTS